MLCWLLGHQWKYIHVHHYYDNSFHDPGAPSYRATKRCEKCGVAKTDKYGSYGGGWPTVQQLNGEVKNG